MAEIVEMLARTLEEWGPGTRGCPAFKAIPDYCKSSWYLSPYQHVVEFFFYLAVFGPLFFILKYRAWRHPRWTGRPHKSHQHRQTLRHRSVTEKFLGALAMISFVGLIYYKSMSPYAWRLYFIFQPCHMITLSLSLALLVLPYDTGDVVVQVCSSISWSAILALAFPDMSDYTYTLDKFNFFFEHALMMLIPFILAWSGRVHFVQSWTWVLLSYVIIASYHVIVLQLVAYILEVNIATLMHPPAPLKFLGQYYRLVQYAFCFTLHMVHNGLIMYIARRAENKKDKEE